MNDDADEIIIVILKDEDFNQNCSWTLTKELLISL